MNSESDSKPEVNFSLINLKAFEKPALKLIEAVADAMGILYEPRRIVKRAEAEGEARIIGAQAGAIADSIAERTYRRISVLESRRQLNIENITKLALKFLPEVASDTPVEPDWIVRFFQDCQDITNEEMQSLWARLLAGEVAAPGSFSPRTLNLVRQLQPKDAIAFTRFSTFLWKVIETSGQVTWFPIMGTLERVDLRHVDLTFQLLMHLEALGLIKHNALEGFTLTLANTDNCLIQYYGDSYQIRSKDGAGPSIYMGECLLTESGTELAPLAGGKPNLSIETEFLKTSGAKVFKSMRQQPVKAPTDKSSTAVYSRPLYLPQAPNAHKHPLSS